MTTGRAARWAAAIVVGAAFGLRAWGATHDLPYSFFPDELHFMHRSVAFGSGDLNPHWFHKPALFMYVLFAIFGAYFVVGRLLGWFSSVHDFAVHYFATKGPFLLLARLATVLLGVAAVLLAHLSARRVARPRAGPMAALFLTVAVGHVFSSLHVKADVPASAFMAAAALFLTLAATEGRLRWWLAAGAAAGLGAATKYSPLMMIPLFFVTAWLAPRATDPGFLRRLAPPKVLAATACVFVFFFLGSPYSFLDPLGRAWWIPGVSAFPRPEGAPAPAFEWSPWMWAVALRQQTSVIAGTASFGLVPSLLAAGGAVVLWRRNRTHAAVWAGVPLVFLLVSSYLFSRSRVQPWASPRHFAPIYPHLAVLAAVAVDELWEGSARALRERGRSLRVASTALLLGAVFVPPSAASVACVFAETRLDTRIEARRWMLDHLPEGSVVLVDEIGPPFPRAPRFIRRDLEAAREIRGYHPRVAEFFELELEASLRADCKLEVDTIEHAWWKRKEADDEAVRLVSARDADMGNPVRKRGVHSLDEYRAMGFEYVVTHTHMYVKYVRGAQKKRFPSTRRFYEDLFETELVRRFEPGNGRSGPVVVVHRIATD